VKTFKSFVILLFFAIFFFSCNNVNENPISSTNKINELDNNDPPPHFVSTISVIQNIPKRSYVPLDYSVDIYSYVYNYQGSWTDFSTYDYQTESFDFYCKLDWNISLYNIYTFNVFEIRDVDYNIVYSHTIIKLISDPLQGTRDFWAYGINLNPNQNYQYRIQLYCTGNEKK
jgi:hypothetical protein